MNHTTIAPMQPMSTTQRQPSRPNSVVGTSQYDRMAATGAAANITIWLNAIARPRMCWGTSSVT